MRGFRILYLAVLLAFMSECVVAATPEQRAALAAGVEELTLNGSVQGFPIAARDLLIELYSSSDYELHWTSPEKVADLLDTVRGTRRDGLDPADYHVDAIAQYAAMLESAATIDPAANI